MNYEVRIKKTMLTSINLKNVALIKNLEINFCKGLNILSGETGAGKSILIDGIMLLLGGKYEKTVLRHGCDDGFVEGVFDTGCDKIANILDEFGFEREDTLIVVRKFNSLGRSEIRINGRAATTLTLQKITSRLVDIYGQNEYQSLAKASAHLKIIDNYIGQKASDLCLKVRESYLLLALINKNLKSIGEAKDRLRQADIIRFSLNEIRKVNAQEGELEELIAKRKLLSSGEKIATSLSEAAVVLGDGDTNALSLLQTAKRAVASINSLSEPLNSLYERLDSAVIEIDDIYATLEQEANGLEFDQPTFEKIENRILQLRTLERKYGDYNEIKKFVTENTELLENIEGGEERYTKLTKQKQNLLADTYKTCKELHNLRTAAATEFEQKIMIELSDLGMQGAAFKVQFRELPDSIDTEKYLLSTGLDSAEFYFSANKGQPIKPLAKIISGGELSRFMLALKVVAASGEKIPTLIFDEIDTGIGGRIGQEVAKKLALIAAHHQVLCITHLPQIAAMADNHYFIDKFEVDGQTQTSVTQLNATATIKEISRLSGAQEITTTAEETASQLKDWSSKFKASF